MRFDVLGFPAGLSRPGKVLGWDGTGPGDPNIARTTKFFFREDDFFLEEGYFFREYYFLQENDLF